jgi:hypothetical protein
MADGKSRLPWKRITAVAAAAVSAGIAAGRTMASREVDKQKEAAIEETAEIARGRIRGEAEAFLKRSFRAFALNVGVKAGTLSAVWIAFAAGWIGPGVFAGMVTLLLMAFLLRDLWVNWPTLRMAVAELHRHGWKPRTAISEIVAAQVFDQVVNEASERKTSLQARLVMALAGTDKAGIEAEVAEAVAGIAREVTWDDIRPYVIAAAVKFAVLLLLYSVFVFLVVHAV